MFCSGPGENATRLSKGKPNLRTLRNELITEKANLGRHSSLTGRIRDSLSIYRDCSFAPEEDLSSSPDAISVSLIRSCN